MATVNCSACESLRETAPNLIVNGMGTTECTSLKNNTGLNPSSGHDDCTDLDAMNDCFVGNMEKEVDGYEVCDWKDFMKNFIPNVWTVFKGIICSICGLWTKVTNLEERQDDLCDLMDQVLQPQLLRFGTLPLADSETAAARRCGTQSQHYVEALPDDGTLNPYTKSGQNIGISYVSLTRKECSSNRTEMLEWIAPSHFMYVLKQNIPVDTVVWKISKSEAQSKIGISDYLWERFTESAWTWHESALTPSRQIAWFKICIGDEGLSNNELGVVYKGCSAPNDAFTRDQNIGTFNNASARVYRHRV